MTRIKHIDHVAIAVSDPSPAARALVDLFGLRPGASEHVASQQASVALLHPDCGETALELVAPAGNPSLRRFLDRRGPALHHVCFEVEDLAAALGELKAAGVALIDEIPRRGARGHWVAFLHPKATGGVLFELCQKATSPP